MTDEQKRIAEKISELIAGQDYFDALDILKIARLNAEVKYLRDEQER